MRRDLFLRAKLSFGLLLILSGSVSTVNAQSAKSGTAWGWGEGDQGAIGSVPELVRTCGYSCQPLATEVTPLQNFTSISAGNGFTVALRADGTVWVWGFDAEGEFGRGYLSYAPSYSPLPAKGLPHITQVVAGGKHALALADDGSVWAWGENGSDQLGIPPSLCPDGEYCSPKPVQVQGPNGQGFLTGVQQVSATQSASFALMNDGSVMAWGYNGFNELGTVSKESLVQFPNPVMGIGGAGTLTGVARLSTGSQAQHMLAVLMDGSVVGWGENAYENLGQGCGFPPCPISTPTPIAGLNNVVAVAGGYGTSYAIRNDGIAFAFGGNLSGQLGINANPVDSCGSCTPIPTQIYGLQNVIGVAGGADTGMAVQANGSVYTFGANQDGQIGNGTTQTGSNTPVLVPGISSGFAVSAGEFFDTALASRPLAINTLFTPNDVEFPDTNFGGSAQATFTVTNRGVANLVLQSYRQTGASIRENTYPFEFSLTPPTFPLTLAPGKSTTMTVTFSPTTGGCAQAYLSFTTNSPSSPKNVYLHGCPIF